MPRPTFLDVHPAFNGAETYKCTNEEAMAYRVLLNRKSFKTTGAIASSGDVLLSALLPRSEKVYAVDHNNSSIAVAMLKAIMLDQMGVRAFKALLIDQSFNQFYKKASTFVSEMPPALQSGLTRHGASVLNSHDYTDLRREWLNYPDGALETSRRRLDAVTFVHGDLQDLAQFGPMDLLYVSNACEHRNRDGKSPTLKYLSPLVREDGTLLVARSTTYSRHEDPLFWKHQKRFLATRLGWNYDLYTRKTPPAAHPAVQGPVAEASASLAV